MEKDQKFAIWIIENIFPKIDIKGPLHNILFYFHEEECRVIYLNLTKMIGKSEEDMKKIMDEDVFMWSEENIMIESSDLMEEEGVEENNDIIFGTYQAGIDFAEITPDNLYGSFHPFMHRGMLLD